MINSNPHILGPVSYLTGLLFDTGSMLLSDPFRASLHTAILAQQCCHLPNLCHNGMAPYVHWISLHHCEQTLCLFFSVSGYQYCFSPVAVLSTAFLLSVHNHHPTHHNKRPSVTTPPQKFDLVNSVACQSFCTSHVYAVLRTVGHRLVPGPGGYVSYTIAPLKTTAHIARMKTQVSKAKLQFPSMFPRINNMQSLIQL